jgi:cytochrome c biogenesis protein CcdA
MFTLVALVVTVGFLDSINPSTVGPALYLATRRSGRHDVTAFTLGAFGMSLVGGLVLTLGPGHALVASLPRPGRHTTALLELCLGAASLLAALGLWLARSRVARRIRKHKQRTGRSPLILGATIMAIELPTAFPYFAVIAAVVGSGRRVATQIALIVLFNVIFVAPLVAIAALRSLAHEHAQASLARLHDGIDRHAATLLPALVALVAVALLALGVSGLLTE